MSKSRIVDDYIETASMPAQPLMRDLLACLRSVAPEAEVGIKWGVPAFTQDRILFTFAARKNYVSFFPTPAAIRAFAAELADWETTSSSFKLPFDRPFPEDLVRRIADYRLRDVLENDARWM